MIGKKIAYIALCFGILFTALGSTSRLAAQGRVGDRDVESLMRNMRDDAKSFQPVFNDSLKRSVIRKTSREKDAKNLVAAFVKQANGMLNNFKKTKRADNYVSNILVTASQINQIIHDAQLNPQTVSRWEKVRSELHEIAAAFNIQDSMDVTRP